MAAAVSGGGGGDGDTGAIKGQRDGCGNRGGGRQKGGAERAAVVSRIVGSERH